MLAAAAALAPMPAAAAVEIAFYSKEAGSRFPHAFITLEGTLDRSGERVDSNYGFSATAVTPAVLMGAVKGKLYSESDSYIRSSNSHFNLVLSDEEYDRVMARVATWNVLKQPSYDLNRQNCVFFVADIAKLLGMKTDTTQLMKKPGSFLSALTQANRSWLQSRRASFGTR